MRHLTIGVLAAVALFFSASLAGADIITLSSTYDGTPLAPGAQVSVEVSLDCECAGGAGDPSDYVIVQMVANFDPSILSYNPGASTPNIPAGSNPAVGSEDPGIIVFGGVGAGRNLQILGAVEGDSYYGSTGGPHNLLDPSNVLIFYTSKGFLGTRANGPGVLGTLVFDVVGVGAPSPISIQMPAGETFMIELGDTSQLAPGSGVSLPAPVVVNTPEPTTALLLGLGLVGLGVAGRRRA